MNYLLQYIIPHHALTRIVRGLAHCRWHWWKTWAIKYYIRRFQIDLTAAQLENIEDYPDVNSFFIRRLKSELRPIVQGNDQIACPVDGCVSQIGNIEQDILFQAKGFNFSLSSLFAGFSEQANLFLQGKFTTLYLAPQNYHRIHMPMTGQLRTTIYVPGRLFSVNRSSVSAIPNLFSRNERLICLFDTEAGPMAVILVGAMLIGTIHTVWPREPDSRKITIQHYSNIILECGAELGQFHMGSTVLVLFGKNAVDWTANLKEDSPVQMGQLLATRQL